MAKQVRPRPEWIRSERVVDVCSVSNCVSSDFADFIGDWKHNGYWFFDSPKIIQRLASQKGIDLQAARLFYYEVYELEFDEAEGQWASFTPESSFVTEVVVPREKVLEGYDVVTFSAGAAAECSPLSCNGLAAEVHTNRHCLLESLGQAKDLLESGRFANAEPGPCRIFAVYSVGWP